MCVIDFVMADLVVKSIGAVEDHALYGQGLSQVLSGLCFARPCWPSWGPA